jgi:hypothetical protein
VIGVTSCLPVRAAARPENTPNGWCSAVIEISVLNEYHTSSRLKWRGFLR